MKINSLVRRLTDQPIFLDKNGNEFLSYNKIKVVNYKGELISKGIFTIEENSIKFSYLLSNINLTINEKIDFNDSLKLVDFAIAKSTNNIFYCYGFIKD